MGDHLFFSQHRGYKVCLIYNIAKSMRKPFSICEAGRGRQESAGGAGVTASQQSSAVVELEGALLHVGEEYHLRGLVLCLIADVTLLIFDEVVIESLVALGECIHTRSVPCLPPPSILPRPRRLIYLGQRFA